MTVSEIVTKFVEKNYLVGMGAGSLSKMFECSRNEIYDARESYYKQLEEKELEEELTRKNNLPRILILDIETAPIRAYVWSRWKQNVSLSQTISEWFCLSWSAKWLFDSETLSDRLTGEEVLAESDGRMMKGLWDLLEEADMIVAHNGDQFDIPKINARFIVNGLPPTSPYKQIDTLKVARKQFGFSSNKLDALAIYFGFEKKIETSFELWSECMKGNEESLMYMEKYNRHDVELLEEVYLKLRPWIASHPNVALYSDITDPQCAHCGSIHMKESKPYYTSIGEYKTYRCGCGAINRVRFSSIPKEKRNGLLISTNR